MFRIRFNIVLHRIVLCQFSLFAVKKDIISIMKKRLTKERLWLVLILSFAFLLRVINLSGFPTGFNADEVAQGYTAYSILKTGHDEWGKFLPINPRSVGDYKLPLYTYLAIPSIAIFGLNEFAVRFPSVLFGTLAVLAVYLLVKEFFKDGLRVNNAVVSIEGLSCICALLLAISPWHISLSRGAFEAALTVFFLPFGIWLFLRAGNKPFLYILSAVVFGLNLFSYHAARFVTPVIVLALLFLNRRSFLKSKLLKCFAGIFLLFITVAFATFISGSKTRVADTSIFKQNSVADRQYEAIFRGFPQTVERVFNNKVLNVINSFSKNYLQYFSLEFLFTKGVSESTYGMIPGRGVLYFFELPLAIICLWQIIRTKDKHWLYVLFVLMVCEIPVALAKGERAGNRAAIALPFWQVISGYGAVVLISFLRKFFSKKLVISFFSFIIGVFLLFFLEDYFFHAPTQNAPFMAYPWKAIGEFVASDESKYDKIVISRNFSEPQTMIAFYLKMDPKEFQKHSPLWLEYEKKGFVFVDQLPEYYLGKYEFRNFRFPEDSRLQKTLLIGKNEDFFGTNGTILKTFYYPDPWERVAARIVTFN